VGVGYHPISSKGEIPKTTPFDKEGQSGVIRPN